MIAACDHKIDSDDLVSIFLITVVVYWSQCAIINVDTVPLIDITVAERLPLCHNFPEYYHDCAQLNVGRRRA